MPGQASRDELIAQPDGNHVAYACEAPDALGDAIMLTSLRDRLPDGRLHPRDMAWIAKRLLFLSAALGKMELRFSTDASECLAISPASHMLAVVAPWELEKSDGSVRQQRELVGSCIGHMREMSGSARIMRFLDGVMVDNYTQSCDLLREFDELLHEMFGRPRFHVMETRDA